ncbi:MAG TPA: glycosyltransferase family 39 protein [Candidatus Paceibacterota bacterium]|nr:glycosyltransferase family 39 protein [Candidatus Paceibacterota bacterium]
MRKFLTPAAAALCIVIVATVLAILSSRDDAPIVDEVPHIGAGYSYVSQLDYRLNPEHPPLVKDIAGFSVSLLHVPASVFMTTMWMNDVNGQWEFGRNLIFHSGLNADAVKTFARTPEMIFFLVACWIVWRWMSERYSKGTALLAVTLLAFSPTVLAHARLVTTDMAAATGAVLATYFFVRFLRRPGAWPFVWSTLTLGIALVCKFNDALLGPFFLLVAFLWGLDGHIGSSRAWKNAARMVGYAVAIGAASFILFVWPLYIVQTLHEPIAKQHADTIAILGAHPTGILQKAVVWASDKPIIRAAGHWGLGLSMVAQRESGGNTIYWMGRVVTSGGVWYFPIIYLLKEPIAWWILMAFAVTAFAFHRRRHAGEPKNGTWWARNADEWVWVLWLIIYWAVSMQSTLNIGIRHLLPVYPFTIMLVAGRIGVMNDWLRRHNPDMVKLFTVTIGLLVGWYVFESVSVYPFYLTYFNQIAGGPSGGYRYVTDSNLDWGQDIKRLGIYVDDNRIRAVSLDYFGWSDPSYYLGSKYVWTTGSDWKDAKDFIRRNRSDGWIAVSATFFQESVFRADGQGAYRWLLDYTPVTVIGHSIFVWHITK